MKHALILMSIGILFAALCAADTMKIQPVKVLPGKQVALRVSAEFSGTATAAELQLTFNPKILKFDRMETSALTKDALHAVHDAGGILRAAFASAEPFPADRGTLCTLWFTVVGSPTRQVDFKLDRMLVNDRPVSPQSLRVDLAKPLNRIP